MPGTDIAYATACCRDDKEGARRARLFVVPTAPAPTPTFPTCVCIHTHAANYTWRRHDTEETWANITRDRLDPGRSPKAFHDAAFWSPSHIMDACRGDCSPALRVHTSACPSRPAFDTARRRVCCLRARVARGPGAGPGGLRVWGKKGLREHRERRLAGPGRPRRGEGFAGGTQEIARGPASIIGTGQRSCMAHRALEGATGHQSLLAAASAITIIMCKRVAPPPLHHSPGAPRTRARGTWRARRQRARCRPGRRGG